MNQESREITLSVPSDIGVVVIEPQKNSKKQRQYRKVFSAVFDMAFRRRLFDSEEHTALQAMITRVERESNIVQGVKSRFMSKSELAEYLGWSETKVWRVITSLRRKNAIAVARAAHLTFIVNPALAWAGGEVNKTLLGMFRQHAGGRKTLVVNRFDTGLLLQ